MTGHSSEPAPDLNPDPADSSSRELAYDALDQLVDSDPIALRDRAFAMRRAIDTALGLLDDLPERPPRPSTHSPLCHIDHLDCLTGRLRAALTEGTQPE